MLGTGRIPRAIGVKNAVTRGLSSSVAPAKKGLSLGALNGFMDAGMKFRKFVAITVLVLSSFAASNVAPSKAELEAMYDKAFKEFDANNFSEALKQLDAIDARQPDLAESQNLRGVILMRRRHLRQGGRRLA